MWMHNANLGKRSPRGGRVLRKEKTYFQDTLDHVVAHSYHDWLIWHRLCVVWTSGPVKEFWFLHSGVAGSISSCGDHGMHC